MSKFHFSVNMGDDVAVDNLAEFFNTYKEARSRMRKAAYIEGELLPGVAPIQVSQEASDAAAGLPPGQEYPPEDGPHAPGWAGRCGAAQGAAIAAAKTAPAAAEFKVPPAPGVAAVPTPPDAAFAPPAGVPAPPTTITPSGAATVAPVTPAPPAAVTPVPPAPPAAATPAGAADVDNTGRPWDSRIDSSNHNKTKKGVWSKRKFVSKELYAQVVAELHATTPAPPASTMPQPVTPGVPAPPAPAMLNPDVVIDLPTLMQYTDERKIPLDTLTQACVACNVQSVAMVGTSEYAPLIPYIVATLEAWQNAG